MNKLTESFSDAIMVISGSCFSHYDVMDYEDYAFEGWEGTENLGFRLIRRI